MRREMLIALAIAGPLAAIAAAAGVGDAEAKGANRRGAAIVADVTITPSCFQESLVCGLTPGTARHR
jgi:hypothetical protein